MKIALLLLLASTLFAQESKPLRDFSEPDSPKAAEPATPAPAVTPPQPLAPAPASLSAKESEMRAIAERFAPVLYQRTAGTAEQRRFDYPTIFDFDGDWIGNNNWENAADPKLKIWSYVYYSVIESDDYYFLHYAFYHPRDWSTVQDRYDGVLDQLQVKYKDMVGDSMRKEAEFNHENDLEGVLIIVEKHAAGGPQPVAIETIAHGHRPRALVENTDLDVTTGKPDLMRVEDGHTLLYIESQKHGVHAYTNEQSTTDEPIIKLQYGKTTEWNSVKDGEATYELVPIYKTFWKHARETRERNMTFGTVVDFGSAFCDVAGARHPDCDIGSVGAALRGDHLRPDSALTPWAWGDSEDPTFPLGAWFFDPLLVVQRHFDRADIRNTYRYNPYLGIGVEEPAPAKPAIAIANTTPVAPPSSTPAAPELSVAPPAINASSSPATSASAGSTSQAAKPAEKKPIRDFSEPDEKQ